MKRISSLLLLSLTMGGTVLAKQVDQQTATIVAQNFMAAQGGAQRAEVTLLSAHSVSSTGGPEIKTYYIFDVNQKHGFVVVAGDDIVKPILAYSTTNEFLDGNGMSPETDYWMGLYRDQIQFAVEHNLSATKEATADWNYYIAANGPTSRKPTAVSPMLTTTWNQGTYYDVYTPGTGASKTPVGCVATAMAQIMKYWNGPATGTGSYSYNQSGYGTQSADFGATSYQWGLMPSSLNASSSLASKNAVSLLGYHCGVAVRMDYAPGGSGAQVLAWNSTSRSAENAFKNHFGYRTTIDGVYRDDYNDTDWDAILKNELDNGRPLLYAGFGSSGGHAFVFDGYDAAGLFHINWGWGGMSDGYFEVNNLAPSALGIGGGGGNFNYGQQALIKIEPGAPGDTVNVVVSAAPVISSTTITKGDPYTVTAGVWNRGTLDFGSVLTVGLYRAADSSLAGYMPYVNNLVLMASEDTLLTFSATNSNNLSAGDYFGKVLYRPEGNAWVPLPDDLGFTNKVTFTVTGGAPTGIGNTALEQSLMVYPNPAKDKLMIDVKGFAGKVQALQLYNLQGQRISTVAAGITPVTALSVSSLSNGIYYLHIVTDQGTAARKIVVQH